MWLLNQHFQFNTPFILSFPQVTCPLSSWKHTGRAGSTVPVGYSWARTNPSLPRYLTHHTSLGVRRFCKRSLKSRSRGGSSPPYLSWSINANRARSVCGTPCVDDKIALLMEYRAAVESMDKCLDDMRADWAGKLSFLSWRGMAARIRHAIIWVV